MHSLPRLRRTSERVTRVNSVPRFRFSKGFCESLRSGESAWTFRLASAQKLAPTMRWNGVSRCRPFPGDLCRGQVIWPVPEMSLQCQIQETRARHIDSIEFGE